MNTVLTHAHTAEELSPLPTVEDIARPFLQRIEALHEIGNLEPAFDELINEKDRPCGSVAWK